MEFESFLQSALALNGPPRVRRGPAALMVFSITGLLLWSRLTGPRLLAIGLAGSMLAGTLYYVIVL